MKPALLLVVILGPLLIGTVAISAWAWNRLGSTEIGLHGWIALGLGVLATLVIGGGLMALVFYSSRHGYDERVGRRSDESEPD